MQHDDDGDAGVGGDGCKAARYWPLLLEMVLMVNATMSLTNDGDDDDYDDGGDDDDNDGDSADDDVVVVVVVVVAIASVVVRVLGRLFFASCCRHS